MATAAQDERDKPFWLTWQSWLRLAEHSARSGPEIQSTATARGLGQALINTITPSWREQPLRAERAFLFRAGSLA